MAYDKKKIYEQAKEAVTKNNLFFVKLKFSSFFNLKSKVHFLLAFKDHFEVFASIKKYLRRIT